MRSALLRRVGAAIIILSGLPVFGADFERLPITFEANQGQARGSMPFLSRGPGYQLSIYPDSIALTLKDGANGRVPIRIVWEKASTKAEVRGEEPTETVSHYFLGSSPTNWVRGVKHYRKVRVREIYPGVDVVLYGSGGRLEFDVELAPGVDPSAVVFRVEGARRARIDGEDLRVDLGPRDLVLQQPVAYQVVGEARIPVEAAFRSLGGDRFTPRLGDYDAALPLTIDPVLSYASYLGGSAYDSVTDLTTDAAGNAYVVGSTLSGDFPTRNPIIESIRGGGCFKSIDAGAHWQTSSSGLTSLEVVALAVDESGQVLYAGTANDGFFRSDDGGQSWRNLGRSGIPYTVAIDYIEVLVVAPGDADTLYGAAIRDFFATEDGGSTWRTGGVGLPSDKEIKTIAVDPRDSQVVLVGFEEGGIYRSEDGGRNWQASNGGFSNPNQFVSDIMFQSKSPYTVFAGTGGSGVIKSADGGKTWSSTGLSGSVSQLAMCRDFPNTLFAFIGPFSFYRSSDAGNKWRFGLPTLAISEVIADPEDANVFYTLSPIGGLSKGTCSNRDDNYLNIAYETLNSGLSESFGNEVNALVIDPSDPEKMFAATSVVSDGFLAKLSPEGSKLLFATYFGGLGEDEATSVALGPGGEIFVAGKTGSRDFPTHSALQPAHGGGVNDGFLMKFSAAGDQLIYSTFFGGSEEDNVEAMVVDGSGRPHFTGGTESADFPRLNPISGINFVKSEYAFVTRLSASGQQIEFSTYLGGSTPESGSEYGTGIDLTADGKIVVTGLTKATNFPVQNGFQATFRGGTTDGFIAQLSDTGNQILFASYLGGAGDEYPEALVIDASGRAWVGGRTNSADFPKVNPALDSLGGTWDGFLTAVDLSTRQPVYSTFWGGSGYDQVSGLANAPDGGVLVGGYTNSTDFPVLRPFQPYLGQADLFISKFHGSMPSLQYSSWFGGYYAENGGFVAAAGEGSFCLAGSTRSATGTMPATSLRDGEAFQPTAAWEWAGMVARIREVETFIFPMYESTAQQFTSFAISNPRDHAVHLEMTAGKADGTIVQAPHNPQNLDLEGGAQLARFGPEVFGHDSAQSGWVRIDSDSPIGAFMLSGDFASPFMLDGVVASTARAHKLWFTRVYEGPKAFQGKSATTRLYLANPAGGPSTATLRLHNAAGTVVRTVSDVSVPASGVLMGSLSQLFGATVQAAEGYVSVEVSSGVGLVGFEWICFDGARTAIGLNAALDSRLTMGYSAQLGSGMGLFTSIKIVNTSDSTRNVSLTALGEDGSQLVPRVTRTLAPGEVLEEDAGSLFGFDENQLTVGSLRMGLGGDGVVGDVVFGRQSTLAYAAALPIAHRGFREAMFSQVANQDPLYTGLAFYNTSASTTDITIEVFDLDGNRTAITEEPIRLARFQRVSQLLHELLPATAGQVRGYIVVRSTQPIVGQQLFGDWAGTALSAVPPTVFW
ncbi:MAG: SBBP repeat-containing protein [Acidobacteriota bacterium]